MSQERLIIETIYRMHDSNGQCVEVAPDADGELLTIRQYTPGEEDSAKVIELTRDQSKHLCQMIIDSRATNPGVKDPE